MDNDIFVDFDKPMTEREMMDALLKELRSLAFIDIVGLYDENGRLKAVHKMDPSVRRAIASIEVDELWSGTGHAREVIGHVKKVKLWDKKGAIESFMKHLGMFIERIEVKKEVHVTVNHIDVNDRVDILKNRIKGLV